MCKQSDLIYLFEMCVLHAQYNLNKACVLFAM